jgi:hypothetical protein
MSCRRLFALSVQAMLVAGTGPTHATGPISNDSDVLGIKLTMTRDQARKVVSDNFQGSTVTEMPVQIGTPELKKSAIAGFWSDVTPKQEIADSKNNTDENNKRFEAMKAAGVARNTPGDRPFGAVGDHGSDVLMVLFNPNDNGTDIFGVSRYKTFSKSSFPVAKVLLDSLIEKYGPPSRSTVTSYTWMAPAVLDHIQSVDRAHRPRDMHCYAEGDADLFLYESADFYSINNIGQAFTTRINTVDVGKGSMMDYSKCGTVLQVNLTLSDDKVYAIKMSQRLLDLTRAHTELKQFATDFFHQADDAKQAKISKDSQNKPKL